MGFKSLLGALFLLFGLGSGVYQWLTSGLSSPFPFIGVALCLIGAYLIYSDLRKRPRKTVDKTAVEIAALITGVVGGIIAMEKLKSKMESTKLKNAQIEELEAQLEGLRAQGRISNEKYLEIKSMIEELKRRGR
ncbi:MAG: hypothetical protein FGF51_04520 [Candidatus Brockarchaeota archaeon]|nr:hypothetical protein [Candidatus Brockarchaeota archaeon]